MLKKIFIFVAVLLFVCNVSAQTRVDVGVYVLNVGKFDVATGSFTIDFYLSMECEKVCNPSDFEFSNGRAASIDKIIDLPSEKFYRIQANLNSLVDLKKFPFDSQEIKIILEDKKLTSDNLIYTVDQEKSGIDKSVSFTGWVMKEWNASVNEHYYEPYDENYSRYEFKIDLYRPIFNAILKTFLPVIFIVLVMLSSFFLDPDKITTRLAMAGSALVASVMFHISISNQIPPVGYLTFADKFMIVTYLIILASFVMNVIMLELYEMKKTELVNKIHNKTEYLSFVIVALAYTILFLFA